LPTRMTLLTLPAMTSSACWSPTLRLF